MKLFVVAALGCALPRLAAADAHKLLVLQPDGRADAALRARIGAAITRLAVAAEPSATAGELTFGDAATAVGCKPDMPACKDEVLDMLSVDEIAITSVTPKPGGVEIAVQRVARGGVSREATMLLPTGAPPDRLDGLASLFTGKSAPPPAPIGPAPAPPPAPASTPPPAGAPEPAIVAPAPASEPPALPPTVAPIPRPVPDAGPAPAPPVPAVEHPSPGNRRLELVGMGGGAGMLVLGLVLWNAAGGVQDDINKAPTRTRQDLANLRDLESRGDTYAAVGNVLTIGGLLVGGVATYLFIRDRRAGSTATARLTPTVLDHGAGLVLTFGGAP